METDHDEAHIVRRMRVGPHPRDRDEPQRRIARGCRHHRSFRRSRPGDRCPAARHRVFRPAPSLEQPDLERHQDRNQRLGPHLAALPIDEGAGGQHHERCQPLRPHAPRGGPQDPEDRQRADPSPGEESPNPPPGPQRPHERAEHPGVVGIQRPVGRPRPELPGGDRVGLPNDPADQKVVPEVGVVDPHADRNGDAGPRDECRRQKRGVAERERRDGGLPPGVRCGWAGAHGPGTVGEPTRARQSRMTPGAREARVARAVAAARAGR